MGTAKLGNSCVCSSAKSCSIHCPLAQKLAPLRSGKASVIFTAREPPTGLAYPGLVSRPTQQCYVVPTCRGCKLVDRTGTCYHCTPTFVDLYGTHAGKLVKLPPSSSSRNFEEASEEGIGSEDGQVARRRPGVYRMGRTRLHGLPPGADGSRGLPHVPLPGVTSNRLPSPAAACGPRTYQYRLASSTRTTPLCVVRSVVRTVTTICMRCVRAPS